jgi:hypothetical protein
MNVKEKYKKKHYSFRPTGYYLSCKPEPDLYSIVEKAK